MRLPGFLHWKSAPYRSHIIETAGTLSYKFEDLCKAYQWGPNFAEKFNPLISEQSNSNIDSATLYKLRERGLLKRLENEAEGRWLIHCPWAEEHTDGEDAYFFAKPTKKYPGEGFNCFHAHCKYRDIRALRFHLGLTPIEGVEPAIVGEAKKCLTVL